MIHFKFDVDPISFRYLLAIGHSSGTKGIRPEVVDGFIGTESCFIVASNLIFVNDIMCG